MNPSLGTLENAFLDRISAGINPEATSLKRYIAQETYINLKPFSYVGHEYQPYFLDLAQSDPNIDLSVGKCSQIGLSEIAYRAFLALMDLIPGFAALLAMPSKSFAQEVLKTRIASIITQAPRLNALLNKDVNSASVKMFLNSSILFALGASKQSTTSLVNRPIRLIFTDELDKCDPDIVSGLRSRQTHSVEGKPRWALSTPTAPGIGIDAERDGRQIHKQLMICCHCRHEWFPDFYTNVEIPAYDKPIRTLINEEQVQKLGLDLDTARFFCPNCHKTPSFAAEYRKWIIENEHKKKVHLELTPFDAPAFITPADLVTSQITYTSEAEFRNQALGLTSSLSDATINREDIKFTRENVPRGIRIMALDLGKNNHFMSGVLKNNILFVDVPEIIALADLENRVEYHIKKDNCASFVSDSLPYTDIINRLMNRFPMFWGAAYYVPSQPQPELYKLRLKEADEKGLGDIRQIDIQKNIFMDHVAGMLSAEQIVFKASPYDEEIIKHILDMRRVRDYNFSEMRYKWVKSKKGIDHFWHTLIYLIAASKIIQMTSSASLPMSSLLHKFRVQQNDKKS